MFQISRHHERVSYWSYHSCWNTLINSSSPQLASLYHCIPVHYACVWLIGLSRSKQFCYVIHQRCSHVKRLSYGTIDMQAHTRSASPFVKHTSELGTLNAAGYLLLYCPILRLWPLNCAWGEVWRDKWGRQTEDPSRMREIMTRTVLSLLEFYCCTLQMFSCSL
jgi:hypothetical protein